MSKATLTVSKATLKDRVERLEGEKSALCVVIGLMMRRLAVVDPNSGHELYRALTAIVDGGHGPLPGSVLKSNGLIDTIKWLIQRIHTTDHHVGS